MLKEIIATGVAAYISLMPAKTQEYETIPQLEVNAPIKEGRLEHALPDGLTVDLPDTSGIDPRFLRVIQTLGQEFVNNYIRNYRTQ